MQTFVIHNVKIEYFQKITSHFLLSTHFKPLSAFIIRTWKKVLIQSTIIYCRDAKWIGKMNVKIIIKTLEN